MAREALPLCQYIQDLDYQQDDDNCRVGRQSGRRGMNVLSQENTMCSSLVFVNRLQSRCPTS
jgi:hypothetical protein